MREKLNYDNLFVACGVYEDEVEEEVWKKDETIGLVIHTIFINPKRVLIYSKTDENGNIRYYNYKNHEEVEEKIFESSFYTPSNATTSLYCGYIHRKYPLEIASIRTSFDKILESRLNAVGYFIPFDKYMEKKLGVSFDVSPSLASKILQLTNITCGKTFALSKNKNLAVQQLADIGYYINLKKVKIKK